MNGVMSNIKTPIFLLEFSIFIDFNDPCPSILFFYAVASHKNIREMLC